MSDEITDTGCNVCYTSLPDDDTKFTCCVCGRKWEYVKDTFGDGTTAWRWTCQK